MTEDAGTESSAPAEDLQRCPFCAEQIQRAAVRCRYCKNDVGPTAQDGPRTTANTSSAGTALAAVGFALALLSVLPFLYVVIDTVYNIFRYEYISPEYWQVWFNAHPLTPGLLIASLVLLGVPAGVCAVVGYRKAAASQKRRTVLVRVVIALVAFEALFLVGNVAANI